MAIIAAEMTDRIIIKGRLPKVNKVLSLRKIVYAHLGFARSIALEEATVKARTEIGDTVLCRSAKVRADIEIELICSVGSAVIVKMEGTVVEILMVIHIVLAFADHAIEVVDLCNKSIVGTKPSGILCRLYEAIRICRTEGEVDLRARGASRVDDSVHRL